MRTYPTYHFYVSMAGEPCMFTTSDAADDTAKMLAVLYAEQKLVPKDGVWVKFYTAAEPAYDTTKAQERGVVEWSPEKRTATVSLWTRTADGYIVSGSESTKSVVEFAVKSVPRFVSPLAVKKFVEDREQAELVRVANELAEQIAAEADAKADAEEEPKTEADADVATIPDKVIEKMAEVNAEIVEKQTKKLMTVDFADVVREYVQ